MNMIPIVFAFDNNLAMPAAVCIFSLLGNANDTTTYDIFILKREDAELDLSYVKRVMAKFPRHKLTVRPVGDNFDKSFEIRGITTPAYYRLLIPNLISEYDKVLYSDVDVIFREDLTAIYNTEIGDNLFAGVNSTAHLNKDSDLYYRNLGLDPEKIIYSGNLIINSAELRKDRTKMAEIESLAKKSFKFQDMDVINIAAKDRIYFLPPSFCLTNYFCESAIYHKDELKKVWTDSEIRKALETGLVHFNGNKPWNTWCVNFDIWWQYYRNSPILDEEFYFRFFYDKLDELDRLPLKKRIKILARYFIHGKK